MRGVVLVGVLVICWFMALMILLPIGLPDEPDGEPRLKLATKFLLATVLSVVGFGIFYALVQMGYVDI